jgi:hypothetical protein
MNTLEIIATQSTPSVVTNWQAGTLEMKGDSYPENSFDFFAPVLAWVQAFLNEADQPLRLELHLLYLNTSSVKVMMDIFDIMEESHQGGKEVYVNWYYESDNERIAELAEEFKEDCSFPFEIVLNAQ